MKKPIFEKLDDRPPPPYRVVEVIERARLKAAEKELRDFEGRYGSASHLKEACAAVREIREKLQDRLKELGPTPESE